MSDELNNLKVTVPEISDDGDESKKIYIEINNQ